MKRTALAVFSLFIYLISFAGPKIKGVVNNGAWNSPTTWDLNRVPVDGDTVLIPAGIKIIINNTQDLNTVYIKVLGTMELNGGKLNLNTLSTIFVSIGGKIFGHGSNDKIRIGNTEKFRGSDPTISAIVTPFIANSSSGTGFSSVTLPVKYLGFSVSQKGKDAVLDWATAEEQNADRYEVERSTDGTAWSVIAHVMAAGNTSSVTNYSFIDRNVAAQKVFYRIKQVDVDGRFSYTQIRSLINDAKGMEMNVAAVGGKIVVQLNRQLKGATTITISSSNGQLVGKTTINNPSGQIIVDNNGLSGMYIVSLHGQTETVSKKVVL